MTLKKFRALTKDMPGSHTLCVESECWEYSVAVKCIEEGSLEEDIFTCKDGIEDQKEEGRILIENAIKLERS